MKKRAVAIGTILLTVLAAWLLWRGKGEMRPRTTRPLNLLLISIDTLRPDHLGSYGYAPAQTPNIDSLAARGVRFTDAVTVSPLTLPAHTSLLTGTFPAYHGVQDNGGFYLNTKAVTLAKTLRDAGYRTGAFVGAFVLDSRWGLNQGFDYYFDHFDVTTAPEGGMDRVQRRGNEVADQALEWLSSDEERPFLAWVHLYDPHAAYEAPQSFASRFPPTSVGAYDAEIAFADAQVGRLIDRLSRDGRLDHTLVVIVGDHGESLGEHGEEQHGFFLYDATLRIPLILFGGGLTAHVARDQVRIVDVMPTVLDDVPPDSEAARTEIFGPVLSLIHAQTIEEAIALVNGRSYGNMACIFTTDGANARRFRYDVDVSVQRMGRELFRRSARAGAPCGGVFYADQSGGRALAEGVEQEVLRTATSF